MFLASPANSPKRAMEFSRRRRRARTARAVVLQLADRFEDVRQREVRALLRKLSATPRRPAARELLQRADVQIAVVEEALERGHAARKEAPVLADAVAAHRRCARAAPGGEKFERARLRRRRPSRGLRARAR